MTTIRVGTKDSTTESVARARVAILSRWRKPDDPELIAARQALNEARKSREPVPRLHQEQLRAEHIRRLIRQGPPLSEKTRLELVEVLRIEGIVADV